MRAWVRETPHYSVAGLEVSNLALELVGADQHFVYKPPLDCLLPLLAQPKASTNTMRRTEINQQHCKGYTAEKRDNGL